MATDEEIRLQSDFLEFLNHTQAGGKTALNFFYPNGKKGYHYVETGQEAAEIIEKHNGNAQIYYSLNPVRPDTEGWHNNSHVIGVQNLVIDVDPHKQDDTLGKDVSKYAATEAEKDKAVKDACIIENWLVSNGVHFYTDDTGNGRRFIIPIPIIPIDGEDEKVHEKNIETISAKLKAFQKYIVVETGVLTDTSVLDPRRITGVPGTLNCKRETETRKNKMRIPTLPIPERVENAHIRDLILLFDVDAPQPVKDAHETTHEEDDIGYADSSRKMENILLDWIEYDNLKHNGKLGKLLKGDISEYYNDRSDAEMALYTILRRYRFSINEIEDILSSGIIGKWGSSEGGESYQRATRGKAISHTAFVSLETYNEIKTRKDETLSLSEILSRGTLVNGARLTINLPGNHFISKYVKWMSGLTDAYQDYSIMAAFWLLSAACQGKVYVDLKQGDIYPNLYILLFGLSTVSRKTTVIKKTKKVFEACTQEKLYNDDYSLEGYTELVEETEVCNTVRDEVVSLFQKYEKKYNDGIHEAECTLYDCEPYRKTLSSGRQGKKREVIINCPYVTHLYATTPDNFSHCLSLENFYSGFGFRFLYCHPRYERERMPLATATEEDREAFASVVTDYIQLYDMFRNMNDKKIVSVDPDAMSYLEHIRDKVEKLITETNDNNISSAWGRNSDHILKLATLIEVGKEVPSLNISLETMKEACRITTEYFLPTCIETLNRLQEDVKNNKIEKVRGLLVRNNGTCDHGKLLRNSNLVSREFNEVIQTMIESKEIEAVKENGSKRTWYILNSDSTREKLSSLSSYSSYSSCVRTEKTNATNFTNSQSEGGNIHTGTYCSGSSYESTNVTNSTNSPNCEDERPDNLTPLIEDALNLWEKTACPIFAKNAHKAKLDIVKYHKMYGINPQLIHDAVDKRAAGRCVDCGSDTTNNVSQDGRRCKPCHDIYSNPPPVVIPEEFNLEDPVEVVQ